MKKYFIGFLFFVYSILGFSQFINSFSDGNFEKSAIWQADIGIFEVDADFKLHLNDIITNLPYLSTYIHTIINVSWKFEIKLISVVWTEVFSENGNMDRFKEVVAISR